MQLNEVNTLFSIEGLNYLAYPEARALVKQVDTNVNILLDRNSQAFLTLQRFLSKNLKDCEQSLTITIIALKALEFLCVSLSRFTGYCLHRNEVLDHIKQQAAQILKDIGQQAKQPTSSSAERLKEQAVSMSYAEFNQSLDNLEINLHQAHVDIFSILAQLPIPKKIELAHSYEHHQLCDRITHISDQLAHTAETTQTIWKRYLQAIHSTELIYPDNYICPWKTSFAQRWLVKERRPDIQVRKIEHLSAKELPQILKIEREAFVASELNNDINYDSESHKNKLISRKCHQFFVAYDLNNQNKIVGIIEYNPLTFCVFSIARKASYAKSRVGQLLWNTFVKDYPNQSWHLYVRESNPAKEIYKKWGFAIVGEIAKNYYSQPTENGIIMRRA